MNETARKLILGRNLCVLATCGPDGPLPSLMSYVAEPDCSRVYLATLIRGAKWRNVLHEPRVGLLIDTREDIEAGRRKKAMALSLHGRHATRVPGEPGEAEAAQARGARMLLAVNPGLSEILHDPDGRVLEIELIRGDLIVGLTEVHPIDFTGQEAGE